MAEIDITTGKVTGDTSRGLSLRKGTKPLNTMFTATTRLPTTAKGLYIFYASLRAIGKLKGSDNTGIVRLTLEDYGFSISLVNWNFRAYFRIRVKTGDFVLVRTSFGGMTDAKLHRSISYVKNVQESLQIVEKFIHSQKRGSLDEYPHIVGYNEEGWK